MWEEQEKSKAIGIILNRINEGESLVSIFKEQCEELPCRSSFEMWLEGDYEGLLRKYARACEVRADLIFEETFEIVSPKENDIELDEEGNELINHKVIQRDRLMLDQRKWFLSKLSPKKYGDSHLLKIAGNEGQEVKPVFPLLMKDVPADNSTE